ncbi:MAG TPA: 50S ribosomal protein L18 [Candidatus Nitrosocosmicus sp.]|nr:50S ribosomal protein L18 [Candidatus Nitrosocosmicus sp.]
MNKRRLRTQKRVRSKIIGHTSLLRLSVYRSNKFIYAQAIDDSKKVTVAAETDRNIESEKSTKTDKAMKMGLRLAQKLKELKVESVVFDRGSYPYMGRIKAVAEGLREGGITI